MEHRGENRGGMAVPSPARLDWVDVARGIGIIAVVTGHVWTRGPVRDAMYSFHMPLFFLLSGLLSRPQPVGRFTMRQIVGQMRPYALFLLFLILADQIIEPLKGNRPIFHQWPQDIGVILLGGGWLRGPYTIFWFVPCLMVARIAFNAMLQLWPDPFDRRWALMLLPVLLLAYGLGQWTQASPLGLLTVPMAFILLWVGSIWSHTGWRAWMVLPLGLLAAAGLAGRFPTLNMKAADYGWPLLSIGAAIATSLLLFRLCAHVASAAGPLATIGRASLTIMYLHVAIIHYLSPYLGKGALLVLALLAPFALDRLVRLSPRATRWLL